MTHAPLLEQLTSIADQVGVPLEVGAWSDSPAPETYLVATPLVDVLDVFADNHPGVEIEEVRLSLFTTGNYLTCRNLVTSTLIEAGLTITGRRYVGFEVDTGYHHYALDIATHHPYHY